MLTLHVYGPAFGLPDPSPFVMKGEMLLKLSGLEYKTEPSDVRKAPKGKFPVLLDGSEAIADTAFIRKHLEQKYGIDFDKGLSDRDKGIAMSVEKMLEDNIYWAILYERWQIDENFNRGPKQFFDALPPVIRPLITKMVRKQLLRNVWGHGMSRHSHDEIAEIANAQFTALSNILGKNKYLMGNSPCGADATVFSFAAGALCPIFDSKILPHVKTCENLVAYNERMMKEFYPDL